MAVRKSIEDDRQIYQFPQYQTLFLSFVDAKTWDILNHIKSDIKIKKSKASHLQSLNIHKQDSLILTHVMSYVFQMISVERGIKYTDLEKESPWELGVSCTAILAPWRGGLLLSY